jgi:phosphoribosyl-AMP cyclohydrolase / phosphoribosyl-ATP pyrophosphohydrolase
MMPAPEEVSWGPDGLVPAVVQDSADGRVLMLAWMDREALAATTETGQVHFHSRSRGRLWRKGEQSGNVLHVRDVALDCDADALLVTADPAGPTCHTGARSCFDAADPASGPDEQAQGFAWLEDLWSTIGERARERPADSYTVSLLDGGVDAVSRKVAEEATEVVLAAKDHAAADDGDRARASTALSGELADLLYHTVVLMAERGLEPRDVMEVLRARSR